MRVRLSADAVVHLSAEYALGRYLPPQVHREGVVDAHLHVILRDHHRIQDVVGRVQLEDRVVVDDCQVFFASTSPRSRDGSTPVNRLARAVDDTRANQPGHSRHGQFRVQAQVDLVVEYAQPWHVRRRRAHTDLYRRAIGNEALQVLGNCPGLRGWIVDSKLSLEPFDVDAGEEGLSRCKPTRIHLLNDPFKRRAAIVRQVGH